MPDVAPFSFAIVFLLILIIVACRFDISYSAVSNSDGGGSEGGSGIGGGPYILISCWPLSVIVSVSGLFIGI